MKATINIHDINYNEQDFSLSVDLTDEALEDIRFKFNPSNLDSVNKLKAIAATYLSLLTQIRDEMKGKGIDAAREFAIARTDFQKVSMMAVLAATKGLK